MAQIAEISNQLLNQYGLAAIFLIMLLKEIGIPVPIPSDLIMLGAAAGAAAGKFDSQGGTWVVFLAILVPMFLGGLVQYALAKGPGRAVVYRLGKLIGLTEERLDRAMQAVRKGGTTAVTIGLITPGLRIATIPASGLADLSLGTFAPGLLIGSAIFLAGHFALGYVGGIVLAVLSLSPIVLVAIVLVVLAVGVIGWRLVRQRARAAGHAEDLPSGATFAEWTDASCPVCVAIAVARQRQELHPVTSN